MNLIQLIQELEVISPSLLLDDKITSNILETSIVYERLKQVDEFKNSDLRILNNSPIPYNGKIEKIKTIMLKEEMSFKGITKLSSISLSPLVYDPSESLKPVKDNCTVTPLIYDPIEFTPYKSIILRYDPEKVDQNELHKKLDDIMADPTQYQCKGHRYIMISGIFTIFEDPVDKDNPVKYYSL